MLSNTNNLYTIIRFKVTIYFLSSVCTQFFLSNTNNLQAIIWLQVKIDNTQQNNKCRLCGDRDDTINHIISECSKLAQKEYKTRHDWLGKVIHWKLCKKLKFDHTTKQYMNKPEFILENEILKTVWDFEIQTNHLIQEKKIPDQVITNKK